MTIMSYRIRSLRKALGLNQAQLAQAAETFQARISEWENGVSEPQNGNLRLLAKALRTSSDFLLGLTDTADPTGAPSPSPES